MSTPAEPTNIERTRALLRRPLSPLDLAENTRAVAARGDVRSCPSRSLLVFVLGGERLGLEADDAGRVLPVSTVRRVPHRTNAVFAGVATIGGELTLVAHAGAALGISTDAAQTHFVLIGRQGERWAFAVDSVEGIRRVEDAQMLPPPATVRHAADGCTKYLVRTEAVGSASTEGVASANNAAPPLVHVLDVDRLTALFARSLA